MGLTQIIDRVSLLQSGLAYKRQWGYLSDPYKLATIGFVPQADQRPGRRDSLAWQTRYKRFFEKADAALSLDYRYFFDDWEVDSQTLGLAWQQNFGQYWSLTPSLRFYRQSAAEFYGLVFAALPEGEFYSSDYRLADFNANTYGLRLQYRNPTWLLALSWEEYRTGEAGLLGKGENANPGQVDFSLVTLEMEFAF